MAKNITQKRKIGDLGEDIAELFHVKQGFRVMERNYLRKWGEIDIILEKQGKIHFIEVKTVSCVENSFKRSVDLGVTYETHSPGTVLNSVGDGGFRPEDNLHPRKLQRLARTMQSYLLEKNLEDTEWQLDAAIVYLDTNSRKARVKIIENIII